MIDMVPYRAETPRYQDVWDWDLIVHPDGSIRVMCNTTGCLYDYGHMGRECDCAERGPRISSPVVDEYRRPLKEDPYGLGRAGTARHLLGVTEGSAIPVMSGKMYRLNGPQTSHEGWRGGSIWKVYAEKEPEKEPPGLLQKVWDWLQQ